MIPLTVCVAGSTENWLQGAVLCLAALIGAWANQALGFRRLRTVRVATLAILVPLLFTFGQFQFHFDPAWRWGCGFSPDPNIQVYFAVMVWPIFVLLTSWQASRYRAKK